MSRSKSLRIARSRPRSRRGWCEADEELKPVDLESIAEIVRADENFVWIDLSEFAVADLERLAGRLSIDRRALHAAVSPWQRPQVDVYRDHFFVSSAVARVAPSINGCWRASSIW
ncbi:CorA family divalent cation transporter [Thermomicrobiaceae bacterium CFH 74404]|uniref:CorA family divalent cation transporter n=1 Tax=Thermalbibacter longus TaxID=2951981 RepID=A0AA41WE53_9BACT|nr:CorA family divalent cation transporter [Thermalbibacter longus]